MTDKNQGVIRCIIEEHPEYSHISVFDQAATFEKPVEEYVDWYKNQMREEFGWDIRQAWFIEDTQPEFNHTRIGPVLNVAEKLEEADE